MDFDAERAAADVVAAQHYRDVRIARAHCRVLDAEDTDVAELGVAEPRLGTAGLEEDDLQRVVGGAVERLHRPTELVAQHDLERRRPILHSCPGCL